MDISYRFIFFAVTTFLSVNCIANENVDTLAAEGRDIFNSPGSCSVCHSADGSGGIGPNLLYSPEPSLIQEKINTVPQMAGVKSMLDPDINQLLALAVYIASLADKPVADQDISRWREELTFLDRMNVKKVQYPVSPRDEQVLAIKSFDTVTDDWQRHAKRGSLKRSFDVNVVATYDPGEPVFDPQPGSLYFYENTGTASSWYPEGSEHAATSQVVVGNADEKTIITSKKMPANLRGAVHTTVMSPDGRFIYITGPNLKEPAEDNVHMMLRTPATLIKVDALTLQPIKQLSVGGRLHHGQLFQDRYILMDTFNTDPEGLDVFLFDPQTDTIVGGISTVDLGGSSYTAFTDNEHIYVLMQPGSDGGGLLGAMLAASGENTADLPYWVAKIDPVTWEVVAEYPFRGYRGDWVAIDSAREYLYVPAAGSSNVTKINNKTGEIVWSAATGIGPYGATLTADEKQLWVSNKGEGGGFIGRTLTVMDVETGRGLATLFSGYQSDHVLLAPNGEEMWVTSNGEGRIYVFDVATREQTHVIDMPGFGDPHGLVWVYYDEKGNGKVVRDQGGFHNGIHPAKGRLLH